MNRSINTSQNGLIANFTMNEGSGSTTVNQVTGTQATLINGLHGHRTPLEPLTCGIPLKLHSPFPLMLEAHIL